MEFGKHIGKGIWGFADKSLTAVYGLGFIFLVIRVLPPVEYGSFVLVQGMFTLLTTIASSFALQPMIKYASESDDYGGVLTVSTIYFIGFLGAVTLLLLPVRVPFSELLDLQNAGRISDLLLYLPPLLFASAGRTLLSALLQTRYLIQRIFWIDSVYFIGSLVLFFAAQKTGMFTTAEDLMSISITTQVLSSVLAVVLAWKLLKFKRKPARNEYRRIWDFGKISCASSVSFAVYAQLDIFLISPFLGVAQTAVLGVVKTFTRIFDIFNQVVQLFIIPASSKIHSSGNHNAMRTLLEKAVWFSTLGLLPVLLLFVFGSDVIISVLYAGRYAEAVTPLRIAGLLALLAPWYSVLPSILVGVGKVKEGLYISWVFIGSSIVIYLILIPIYGVIGAVIGSVLSSLILSISVVLVVRKFIPISARSILGRTRDVIVFIKKKI